MRVHVHDMTAAWGTVTVAGPKALGLLAGVSLEVPVDELPHMRTAHGTWNGKACRVARASFTGERSYEISVPALATADLWLALFEAGTELGLRGLGIEGVSVLRAEKGYPIVGRDTDATTMPQDLGAGGPRLRRTDDFVGKRSLFTEEGKRQDRRQLVGIECGPGEPPLPVGAHAVERHRGRMRSIGFITTSHASPTLGRPIALALLEGGASRHGETVAIRHLGTELRGIVTHPCAYDRQGTRLDA
jgi:sarcosine oxidase subunit alpha